MDFKEYQEAAKTTAGHAGPSQERMICASLALCGEAGELANYVKKGVWHGHGVLKADIMEELGDTLWYISEMCEAVGLSLDLVAQFNIDKLKRRYPEGFSEEASINRKE